MICVKRENIYIWKILRTNYHVSFRTLLELYSNAVENNPQRINAENIDTPSLSYPALCVLLLSHYSVTIFSSRLVITSANCRYCFSTRTALPLSRESGSACTVERYTTRSNTRERERETWPIASCSFLRHWVSLALLLPHRNNTLSHPLFASCARVGRLVGRPCLRIYDRYVFSRTNVIPCARVRCIHRKSYDVLPATGSSRFPPWLPRQRLKNRKRAGRGTRE